MNTTEYWVLVKVKPEKHLACMGVISMNSEIQMSDDDYYWFLSSILPLPLKQPVLQLLPFPVKCCVQK